MKISPQVAALLPLRTTGQRMILSATGATVCVTPSVKIGLTAANDLEATIVVAVNSYQALVAALAELLASAIDASPADPLRFTRACSGATESLLMAGAA